MEDREADEAEAHAIEEAGDRADGPWKIAPKANSAGVGSRGNVKTIAISAAITSAVASATRMPTR